MASVRSNQLPPTQEPDDLRRRAFRLTYDAGAVSYRLRNGPFYTIIVIEQ
jgi:hypothetical protein